MGVTFQGTSPSDLFPPAGDLKSSTTKWGQAFNTPAFQGDFIFNCSTCLLVAGGGQDGSENHGVSS